MGSLQCDSHETTTNLAQGQPTRSAQVPLLGGEERALSQGSEKLESIFRPLEAEEIISCKVARNSLETLVLVRPSG